MIAEKLKYSVLLAAFQGKLSKQLPEDGDIYSLMNKIQMERIVLAKKGILSKLKRINDIIDDEIPFDIPEHWKWVRLEFVSYNIGRRENQIQQSEILSEGFFPVVSQSSKLVEGFYNDESKLLRIVPQSVIVFGDHSKSLKLVDFDFIIGADGTKIIVPIVINPIYLFYVLSLNIFFMRDRGYSRHYQFLNEKLIPLPPLEEQNRIVENLSNLLEEIEKLKNNEIKMKLLQSTFSERMKKSVIQYAIQGKLTEQLIEDGNAENILIEIDNEKSNLLMRGEVKKSHHSKKITPKDIPFDVPENWRWCYLKDVSLKIHYGYNASASNSGNAKLLRISDIQNNQVSWNQVPYCSIKDNQLDNYKLQDRDIVVARTGGTIGKTYIVKNLLDTAIFASYLIRVVPSLHINEEYLKYYMESDLYWRQLIEKSQGTGQPNVNGESLKNLMLPLPPKAEQIRIVEKIREILPYIKSI